MSDQQDQQTQTEVEPETELVSTPILTDQAAPSCGCYLPSRCKIYLTLSTILAAAATYRYYSR